MGAPTLLPPVKLFLSALSADEAILDSVGERLSQLLGPVDRVTAKHPWNFSPAYTRELGSSLQRRYVVLSGLYRPECLPDIKIRTNELEAKLALGALGERRINLDPGYVSGSQVILASTKRYANRVYLRDGIYADLTLYYDGREFQPLSRFTFPEYRTRAARRFFRSLRVRYLEELRSYESHCAVSRLSEALLSPVEGGGEGVQGKLDRNASVGVEDSDPETCVASVGRAAV